MQESGLLSSLQLFGVPFLQLEHAHTPCFIFVGLSSSQGNGHQRRQTGRPDVRERCGGFRLPHVRAAVASRKGRLTLLASIQAIPDIIFFRDTVAHKRSEIERTWTRKHLHNCDGYYVYCRPVFDMTETSGRRKVRVPLRHTALSCFDLGAPSPTQES